MTNVRFGVGIYTAEPLPAVVEQAKLVERLGYDSVWLLDSQLVGRELYATMAAVGLSTTRVLIGSGVTQTYTRHSTVTACGHATIDDVAPGRVALGIGRGDSAVLGIGGTLPTFTEFARYIDECRRLMAGERFELAGKTVGLKFVDPAKPPKVPIYVAASGPQALELACRIGDGVIIHCGAGEVMIGRAMEHVREGARKAGKSLTDLDIVWWVHTSIDDDWSKVKEHYRPKMVSKFRHKRPVSIEEQLGGALDAETFEKAKNSYNFMEHATAGAAHGAWADLFPDELWKQEAFLGTPDEVYERCRVGLERNPEIGHVVINPPASGFGITVEKVYERFAHGVIERLRSDKVLAR